MRTAAGNGPRLQSEWCRAMPPSGYRVHRARRDDSLRARCCHQIRTTAWVERLLRQGPKTQACLYDLVPDVRAKEVMIALYFLRAYKAKRDGHVERWRLP